MRVRVAGVAGVAGVALRGRRDRSTAGACAGGGGARRGGHHQKSGQDRRPARAGLRRRGARRAGCRRRRRGSRSCRTGRDRSSDDGSGRDGRQPAEFRPSLRYDERAADRGHPSFVGRGGGLRSPPLRCAEFHRLAEHPDRRPGQDRAGFAGRGTAGRATPDAVRDPLPRAGGDSRAAARRGAAVRLAVRARRLGEVRGDDPRREVPAGRGGHRGLVVRPRR